MTFFYREICTADYRTLVGLMPADAQERITDSCHSHRVNGREVLFGVFQKGAKTVTSVYLDEAFFRAARPDLLTRATLEQFIASLDLTPVG